MIELLAQLGLILTQIDQELNGIEDGYFVFDKSSEETILGLMEELAMTRLIELAAQDGLDDGTMEVMFSEYQAKLKELNRIYLDI